MIRGLVLIAALMALVGWPTFALLTAPASSTIAPGGRAGELAINTLILVGLAEAFALGLGLPLAFGISRTNLPGRHALGLLVGTGLFVPLPLLALAWLGSLGNVGRSQVFGSGPILTGFPGAAFVHGVAALPWVVLIAAAGFRAADPAAEDAALLDRPAWDVAIRVTTRGASAAIGSAALAVAVLTAGEMTVADLIPLRTYAEETYTLGQLGLGPGRLAASTAIPQMVVLGTLILLALRGWRRVDPARASSGGRGPRPFALGRARIPIGAVSWTIVGILALFPIYGMAWRAGRVGAGLRPGRGASWSASGLLGTLRDSWGDLFDPGAFATEPGRVLAVLAVVASVLAAAKWFGSGGPAGLLAVPGVPTALGLMAVWWAFPELSRSALPGSILAAGLGAAGAVAIAWALAWRSTSSRIWLSITLAVFTMILATPGPVAGLALKLAYVRVEALNRTPALMVLGLVARSLPFALLMIAPSLGASPRDEADSAALDGLAPGEVARLVLRPPRRRVLAAAFGLAFAVGLGELPASYVLRAPGYEPLSVYVWSMLHVGVESRLAGVGLVLWAIAAAVGVASLLALEGTDPRGRRIT